MQTSAHKRSRARKPKAHSLARLALVLRRVAGSSRVSKGVYLREGCLTMFVGSTLLQLTDLPITGNCHGAVDYYMLKPLLQWASNDGSYILLQKQGIQIMSQGHCRELHWTEPFEVPEMKELAWLEVSGIGEPLHKALAYTSHESSRYALHCILLEPTGEVIATDGKRMAVSQSAVRYQGKPVKIPGSPFFTLTEIKNLASLAVTDSRVILQGRNWLLVQPKSEGRFPCWRDVLPTKSYIEIRPDPALLDVLRKEASIRSGLNSVLLDFNGKEVKFQSEGISDMVIPWITQDPFRVKINPKFLACALREDLESMRFFGENEVFEFIASASRVFVMPIAWQP